MKKLGSIKNGGKNIYPLVSTRPRTMTFADYQLLTEEQKQGDIIIKNYPVPEEGDYVEVVADGVKTWRQILGEIALALDYSKISGRSYLEVDNSFYRVTYTDSSSSIYLSYERYNSGNSYVTFIIRMNPNAESNRVLTFANQTTGITSSGDVSTNVPADGTVFTFYYNKTQTLELGTLAENCMMSDGVTSVADALDTVESTFTLSSGISLWTINKLIIKPNACGDGLGYAHFNISVYGSIKSGDVIATLPSGYLVRSGGCRFGGTLLKSGVVKPTELVFIANSANVTFSGSDFDTASTQYISFNGTIPIKRV